MVGAHAGLGHRADDLGGADHRAAEGLVGEHRVAHEVVDLVLGIVLVHRDLLQHDLALLIEVVEGRPLEHVGQQRHRPVDELVEDAGVENGVVLARRGVDLSAEAVEGLGDLARRAGSACP